MKKTMATAAPWALMVMFGMVAAGGLFVSYRAQCVIENFEADLAALRAENAQLREELAKRSSRTELVVSVSGGEFSPKTLADKNRNPCNVKSLDGDTWKGQIGTDKFGHAIFESPEWSIRACALTVRAYETKHKIRTVQGFVERYCDGNHAEYIGFLCKALGVKKNEEFSFCSRLPEMVRAIAKFECGRAVPDEHLALMAVR